MRNIFLLFCILFSSSILFSLNPVILVLGLPGVGKGTFSQHLKEKYGYNHIGAGDLVRKELGKKTPFALAIAESVKRGEIIDRHIMCALIKKKVLRCKKEKKPFIIDGFGRTLKDVRFLCKLLRSLDLESSTYVLFLEADDVVCKERIRGRWICPQCARVYSVISQCPKESGRCDLCRTALIQRTNDSSDAVEKRFREYHGETEQSYREISLRFPTLTYHTNRELKDCFSFYSQLTEKARIFPGTADQYLKSIEL